MNKLEFTHQAQQQNQPYYKNQLAVNDKDTFDADYQDINLPQPTTSSADGATNATKENIRYLEGLNVSEVSIVSEGPTDKAILYCCAWYTK